MNPFRYIRNNFIRKQVAISLSLILLFQVAAPVVSLALTNGPTSPEFSKFEPVSSSDMVNLFTGDFTYNLPVINIPGPDGAGYALSLSYQSGVNAEQEASWVGFGWNLNPGSINRIVKGLPDDYNGETITKYNKSRTNWSISGFLRAGTETFGESLGIDATKSFRINNYTGLFTSYGLGLKAKGIGDLNFNLDATGFTAKGNINPGLILGLFKKKGEENSNDDKLLRSKTVLKQALKDEHVKIKAKLSDKRPSAMGVVGSNYNSMVAGSGDAPRSQYFSRYWGIGFNFDVSGQINPFSTPVGWETGIGASFNIQKNDTTTSYRAYGYLHNQPYSIHNNDDILTDYYVENSSTYNKRDFHLGAPFSSPDMFALSGEGLGGSFRYWDYKNGHYYPAHGSSKMISVSIGLEGMIGPNTGVGLNLGAGLAESKMHNWKDFNFINGNWTDNYQFNNSGSGGQFRFTNDLGGTIAKSNSNELASAKVEMVAGMNFDPNELQSVSLDPNTSSHIKYYRKSDYTSVNNLDIILGTPALDGSVAPTTLCAFDITNADGNRYVYGYPVFNRNEGNYQVSTEHIRDNLITNNFNQSISNGIYNNHLAYMDLDYDNATNSILSSSEPSSILGEFKKDPYVSNYLLTQILTYDYVDIDDNGPSEDDFGGYTKFHYHQEHGFQASPNDFYQFRSPYTGFAYNKNQVSDVFDDLGAVSYGEKEVNYLEAIETKSHIAFFVLNESVPSDFNDYYSNTTNSPPDYLTGAADIRKDGIDADLINADNDPQAKGDNTLRYLDKIVLFSKERMEKPIKTIHFSYDYSLCKNLPNNEIGDYPEFDNMKDYSESGKLTLNKVWFSYEGKYITRISPYEFDYTYDSFRNEDNQLKIFGESVNNYADILGYADQFSFESQNPNYNNEYLDAWGNINYDQKTRNAKLQKWPYQGDISGAAYDPAAWHLKKITLPSGGEIHIQYEEKDYAYVQNRKAMALVSLDDSNGPSETNFTINPADIGITDPNDIAEYYDLLKSHFEDEEKKIYFKFLYDMTRDDPDLDNCHSEYISGWASVDGIDQIGNNITITLDSGGADSTFSWLPRSACYDYLAQNFYGKESNENNCTVFPGSSLMSNATNIGPNSSNNKSIAKDILETFGDQIEMFAWGIPIYDRYCGHMNYDLSYFKLPMLKNKRGGGVRVKNLLLFDPGLEAGDARLYGRSYDYKSSDGLSSGVAANEPNTMREENALVEFLPRAGQSWYNKLTKGEDRKQTEGTIGESLLPSPSIGYGRVKVNHIHVGKSSTGFTEHHFYTTKDYPYDKIYPTDNADFTNGKGVDFSSISKDPTEFPISLPLVFFTYSLNKARLAQGYRFILNNMNGQPKANFTFGLNALSNPEPYLVSSEQFEYYEVGEKIPMLKSNLKVEPENPGKELDMTMEMKRVAQNNYDLRIEADVSIAVWPLVYVTILPSFSISNSSISTHLTSKVLNYPSVLKKVTNYQEGIYSTMENIAFNEHTGKPLIQKISDDMLDDGDYVYSYSATLPASFVYSDMGQKSKSTQNSNQLNTTAAQYHTYNHNPIVLDTFMLDRVINANVTTHTTSLETPDLYLDSPGPVQLENIRRPHKSFVYKSETSNALVGAGNKVNDAGVIINYEDFDFSMNNNDPSNWIKATEVTQYSTNGLALEEKNALGIYSAAVLGYNDYVPVLNVVNSKQTNVIFESFESSSLSTEQKGHTGSQSYKLISSNGIIPSSVWTQEMTTRGVKIKCWIHHDDFENDGILEYQINSNTYPSKFIAKTGEWALHEIRIGPGALTFSSGMNGSLQTSAADLLIDDVKIQPLESEMKCYVYEKETLRLLAEFDDNHFALQYQYGQDGKLIRKIIETERGIKTIQETQYNTPKKEAND